MGTESGTSGVSEDGSDGGSADSTDGTSSGDGDGTSGDGDGAADCPVDQFPAVSADPANAAYDDPFLNVYCTDTEIIVESNGIPAYEFQAITPNDLGSQDYEWHLPRYPELATQTTEIPLLGDAGIAVNGLPIYGPNEGDFPDPFGDPVYNGIMDFCMGHTAMAGVYHYHALLVECLTADTPADEASPIIGYALDGFPIYGPRGCMDADCTDVVEFQSGWVQTGDPTTYAWDNHEFQDSMDPTVLDECNGRIGPDGTYRYHATSTFPYILGCYAGTPTGGNEGAGGGGGTGGDPTEPPTCQAGQTMCCGDGTCDGPETAANCPADC
jgi:hypothetical protein